MTVDPATAFRTLLLALAEIYRAEGRPGGDAAADAYERAADAVPPRPAAPYRLDARIRLALEDATHPAAVAVREAHAVMPWTMTGVPGGSVFADTFAVVSLIGPGGLAGHDEPVRSGLFLQFDNCWYPPHAHNAEETYVMLAGEGEWSLDGSPPVRQGPGAYIHHPSLGAHSTRTGAVPLLAAWRWSGDIGSESYRILEEGP